MSRHSYFVLATTILLTLSVGCGGVAQNPTTPGLRDQGTTTGGQPGEEKQPGAAENLEEQLGAAAAGKGEEIISGTFETLYPQGLESLETGQLILAGQYFKSALAQDTQSADAAIAYALVDIMRDHRRYALFLHPGVDRLFLNTPLLGHPEAFPNPFLAEDSYVLRLAALGNKTRSLVPDVVYPVSSPIDSERMFNPDKFAEFERLKEQREAVGGVPVKPPEGEVEENIPPGTSGGGGESPSAAPPGGDQPPARNPGTQGRQESLLSVGSDKPGSGKQGAGPGSGPGDEPPPDTGTGRTDTGGFPRGFEGGPMVPGVGLLPERDQPLSEDEWATLIREYRDAAGRDGADILISSISYNMWRSLHEEIQNHIDNLEAVRTQAEQEGYLLSLPFNVIDGTKKITLQFDVDDYNLILAGYRLLDATLSYVEAYEHRVSYWLPSKDVQDKNEDSILTPDEYLPAAPFGALTQEGQDALVGLLPEFIQALNKQDEAMRPLLETAREVRAGDPEPKELFYLSSFHRNFVLIEQWVDHLREIADKSSTGTSIKLAAGSNVAEVVVVYDALFNTPLTDIRLPLPSFDLTSREVVVDEEENWSSDPTFGGFFREGLTDPETYLRSGRLRCVVYDQWMGKARNHKIEVAGKTVAIEETGEAVIEDASVNELVGTPFKVIRPDNEEGGSGFLFSLNELVPLFDTELLVSVFGLGPETMYTSPGGPGDTVIMGTDGLTTMGPATGEAPAAEMPPAEGEGAVEEGEEGEEGEVGEEGQTPDEEDGAAAEEDETSEEEVASEEDETGEEEEEAGGEEEDGDEEEVGDESGSDESDEGDEEAEEGEGSEEEGDEGSGEEEPGSDEKPEDDTGEDGEAVF